MYELTSIAFSHYVEKARWGLDRYGIEFADHKYLPLFHFWPVYRLHGGRAGRNDRASSKFSTPVLKTPSGELLCDSSDILKYLSETYATAETNLYPSDEVAELELHFHDRLGPHTRRAAYQLCFDDPALLHQMARDNVGAGQARAFRLVYPLAKAGLKKALGIDAEQAERSRGRVERELDAVDERLADGRPFLTGDRFTAADLAYACMASLFFMPPEYSATLPKPELAPEYLQKLRAERLETPAGKLVMRLFREERGRVVRQA